MPAHPTRAILAAVSVTLTCWAAGCSDDSSAGGSSTSSGTGAGGSGGDGTSASGGSGAGGTGGTGAGGTGGTGAGGSGGGTGASAPVDPSTIENKHLMGYQGWFLCPDDGAPPDRWVHWFSDQTASAASLTVDMWPDLSELDPDELFPTQLSYADDGVASLYSAWNAKTVARHFLWMNEAGIDGVFLQRFLSELTDPAFLAFRDQVAANVRAGAEGQGRVFAVMYDISGKSEATWVADLLADWAYLVDDLGLTSSPRYLRHDGRPVLAIWGLGFDDRPGTAAQAQQIIDALTQTLPSHQLVTLMGGVPTNWRTLDGDSKTDPAWANVYRSFDILSPWAVGRFADEAGADAFRASRIEPDLAALTPLGVLYMPVVWPGFSWLNLQGGPLNQIPRLGGTFYWHQVYNATDAGASLLYTAMFDEVDEGTAMFKLAPTAAEVPTQASFVTLDIDGQSLPSDWYLRLAGEASRMLRGDIPVSATIPITP